MAWSAEGILTSTAKENCHVAAPHALPVNKFVSMLLAVTFAVVKLSHSTILAQEAFWVIIIRILRFECLSTILHAAKVRLFALETLVECALVQGKLS